MGTPANSRRQKLCLLLAWCLLLALAWGFWLWRLDASDLTFDEAATYNVVHRPLLGILDYLRRAVREHPPTYYLLVRGWTALAGTSEFSLRLFSVCAGLVALPLVGWLARVALKAEHSGVAGLLSAALFAFTPGVAFYARDARMYSLGIVWTALSAGLFLRHWLPARGWPRRTSFASLAAVHLLALFTHYYLLLPILVQPLALLIARRWRPLLAWCALHSLPVAAGLAWLGLAPGLRMTAESLAPHFFQFASPTARQVFRLVGQVLFSPAAPTNFRLIYVLATLIGGGALLALRRRPPVGAWLALTLLVPLALVYALPHPPEPRYLAFLTAPVALGLSNLCLAPIRLIAHARVTATGGRVRRWLAWSATLGLALLTTRLLVSGGLFLAPAPDRSHYGHTLETIKAHARPGDGILFYGPWQWVQFRYYDPGGLPPITALPPHAPPQLTLAEAEPVLEDLLARYDRLWVLPAAVGDVDPARYAEGWLNTHTHRVWETKDFSLHLPPLSPNAPEQRADLAFGQALRLERVAHEPLPVPAGEPLRLTLYWTPLRRLEHDVRLTLALADREGHIWDVAYPIPGRWAAPPSTWEPGQTVADYEGLMVPQGAPPDQYTVRIRVNDAASDEPLLVEGEIETNLLAVQIAGPTHAPVLRDLPNAGATPFCPPTGDDCLTLVGYEPGGLRFQQGYPVPLTLHWLVPREAAPDAHVRLTVARRSWLSGREGASIATATLSLPSLAAPEVPPDEIEAQPPETTAGRFRVMLPLVCRAYASPPAERLLTTPALVALPPDAATGPARVVLEVVGPDGIPWATPAGVSRLPLFNVAVDLRPVHRRLPGGLVSIEADLGDEVGLRGYRVEGELRPGGQVHVTYAWYARTQPTAIYAVFNHLLAADGNRVAQADGWPQGGRMLTIQWQPGEYVEDHYTLTIPPDAPPGPYILYAGLYNAANDERQPAFQDGQRLPEDRVPIPLPGGN